MWASTEPSLNRAWLVGWWKLIICCSIERKENHIHYLPKLLHLAKISFCFFFSVHFFVLIGLRFVCPPTDICIFFWLNFQFQAAILQRWNLPHFMCPFLPFVQTVSVNVSVFTLTAIAVDRHRAIINPLRYVPFVLLEGKLILCSSLGCGIWLRFVCRPSRNSIKFIESIRIDLNGPTRIPIFHLHIYDFLLLMLLALMKRNNTKGKSQACANDS